MIKLISSSKGKAIKSLAKLVLLDSRIIPTMTITQREKNPHSDKFHRKRFPFG